MERKEKKTTDEENKIKKSFSIQNILYVIGMFKKCIQFRQIFNGIVEFQDLYKKQWRLMEKKQKNLNFLLDKITIKWL